MPGPENSRGFESSPRPQNAREALRRSFSGILCMAISDKIPDKVGMKPLTPDQKAILRSFASQPTIEWANVNEAASVEASKPFVEATFRLLGYKQVLTSLPNGQTLWRTSMAEAAGIPSGQLSLDLQEKQRKVFAFADFTWNMTPSNYTNLTEVQKEALIENRAAAIKPVWQSKQAPALHLPTGTQETPAYQIAVMNFWEKVDTFARKVNPAWAQIAARF